MKRDLYLYQSGELKRKDNSLSYLTKKNTEYIPIEQLDQIHIFGECKFNKRVLELLNQYNISVSYYTRYGNFIGRYSPNKKKEPKCIIEQALAYNDITKRNKIIKLIIKASILNSLNFIKYFHHKKGINLLSQIKAIEANLLEIEQLDLSSNSFSNDLMLIEARSKQTYYQLFDLVIKDEKFKFKSRLNNPPKNMFNALLSFGYSMLYANILSAIEQSNLISEISFVHGHTHHKKGALQFDLADLFKPYIIDRLCLYLVVHKKIDPSHFYKTNNDGIFLNEEGRKIVTAEYDKVLRKTITDIRNNKKYSYKQLLKREVYILSNHIKKNENYRPIYFKW